MRLTRLWPLLLSLCLISCSNRNDVALYSLSEQELSQTASREVATLTQRTKLAGLPLHLAVTSLQSRIAPAGRPEVELSLQLDGQLQALVAVPLQWQLTFSAEPYFDQERQAVLIHNLQIRQSQLNAGGWQGRLKPLSAGLAQQLEQLLLSYPLYQLDPNNWQHRLLLNMPLQIQIQPGELVLTPAYPAPR